MRTTHVGGSTAAILFACLLLVSASPASGQRQTGNLYGTVTDTQGEPLPGARVELSGIGAPRTQFTDAQGRFRFLDLSPGDRSLTASLEGFSTVDYPSVNVSVGRNTTLEVTLSPAVEDVITVTSESPLLDERKIQQGTTVSQIELEKIPTARDPWAVVTQTPGVIRDRINVGGNESGQQGGFRVPATTDGPYSFAVDGMVITDMAALGDAASLYDFDAFEDLLPTTGGTDVDVATSGVTLNLVTKRGTNEWRGSGRYLLGDAARLPADFFVDDVGDADLRIDIGEKADGTACLDGFGPADPDGGLPPGAGILEPGEGILAIVDPPIRFLAGGWEGSRGRDRGAPIVVFPSCGEGPSLYGFDFDYSNIAPTHLLVGGEGVQPVDLTEIAPGAKEPVDSGWDHDGPTDIWKIEDTHVFSSDFYLTGLYSYVDGGFQLVPQGGRSPAETRPAGGRNPDGFGLLGFDPSLFGNLPPPGGHVPDTDGDGRPDSAYLQVQNLQNPCPGLYAGFFTVDRPGEGGGSLKPDPAAEGLDCDSLDPLLEDGSPQPGDRWTFSVRSRYGASLALDFEYGGTSPAGDEVVDLRLDRDQQFTDNLSGILSIDAFNVTHVEGRRWIHGRYWIQEEDDDDLDDPETSDGIFTSTLTPSLFAEGGVSVRDVTLGTVLDAPVDGGIQDVGVEFGTGIEEEILFHGDERYAPGGALVADDATPLLHFVARGGSTGEVFDVEIVHPAGDPVPVRGIVAIEPVTVGTADRARIEAELAGLEGARERVSADAYCLEFAADAPPAGTVFRVAGPEKQAAFAPKARALAAARRLHEAGALNPDTSPESYFHSIRQWSVWTMEEGFDADGFEAAFVEHTRKNVAAAGREWSDEIERVVRESAGNRWGDVSRVLEEAAR